MKNPFIFRKVCVNCPNRKSHLFDIQEYVNNCDINGTHIGVIIPGLLWYVSWCKIHKNKKEKNK